MAEKKVKKDPTEFQEYGKRYVDYRQDQDTLPDVKQGTGNLEQLVERQVQRPSRGLSKPHQQMMRQRIYGATTQVLNADRGQAENCLALLVQANVAETEKDAEEYFNAHQETIVNSMPDELREQLVYGFDPVKGNPHSIYDDSYRQVRDGLILLRGFHKKDPNAIKAIIDKKSKDYEIQYKGNQGTIDLLNRLVAADPSFAAEDLSMEITEAKEKFEKDVNPTTYLLGASPKDYVRQGVDSILEQQYQASRKPQN